MRVLMVFLAMLVLADVARAEEPPAFLLRWGASGSGPDQFDGANGVATDQDGNVYVADIGGWSVKKFTGNGVFLTMFQTSPSLPTTAWDVAIATSGKVYTLGGADSVVGVWSPDGVLIRQWGRPGQFGTPRGIAVDDSENVYVTTGGVRKFSSTGTLLTIFAPTGLNNPNGIFVRNGRVYVVDSYGDRIQVYDTNGNFLETFGGPQDLGLPKDATMDDAGNFYITDESGHVVRKFAPDGTLIWTLGGNGHEPGKFTFPTGIALDTNGNLFVSQPGVGCCGGLNVVSKFGPVVTPTKSRTWGELKARYRKH